MQPMDLKKLCSDLRATITSSDTTTTTSCDQRHHPDSSTRRKPGSKDWNGPEHRDQESHSSPCKRSRLNSRSRTRSLEPAVQTQSSIGPASIAECHSGSWDQVPESVYDLMLKCLDLNPLTRISAEQALCHEFLTEKPKR